MKTKDIKIYFYFFSILVVLIFLYICRPSGLYFLADDFVHIPLSISSVFYDSTWLRPVSRISLWLNGSINQINYNSFYITNLLLHFLNSILIFFLALKMQKRYIYNIRSYYFFPLLSSLLFLSYASHTESIFWIVGRGGSLVTVFIQLALIFNFSDKLVNKFFSYLFFAIALFTYELSWSLPLLISFFALCDKYFFQQRIRKYEVLFYWIILLVYFFVRYFLLKGELNDYEAGAFIHGDFLSISYNFFTALARVLVPGFQNPLVFCFVTLLTFLVLICLILKIYKKQKKSFIFFFICFTGICISIIPILSKGANTHNSEAERFIYPATIFWCFIIAYLVSFIKNIFFKHMVFIALIITQLFFFNLSSEDYRYGSYVTKYLINEVNRLPPSDTLNFENLPSAYSGAIIFRSGFPSSAKGILNKEFKKVNVISYKELFKKEHFKTVIIDIHSTPSNALISLKADTFFIYK